jgi:hypothetical protein
MAYDEELAGRIRQLIGSDPELTEKKMFGVLAFLIRGQHGHRSQRRGRRHGPRRPGAVRRPWWRRRRPRR